MTVTFLPAYNGDCIFLNYISKSNLINILIDGGISRTYPQILRTIFLEKKKKKEKIDLLIITHIDDDHIGGIIKLFEDSSIDKSIIKKIWFNSGENISKFFNTPIKENRSLNIIPDYTTVMSIKDGITLENEMKKVGLFTENIKKAGDIENIDNIQIKVLSPAVSNLEKLNKNWTIEVDKIKKMSNPIDNKYNITLKKLVSSKFNKDNSIPNGSSIAILITVENKNILLLGDSHQSTIVDSLKNLGFSKENPIEVELTKLSHHGSKKNTGYDLLNIINCKNYVISTDGSSHKLPNKEVFARILEIHNNSTFYFNYKNEITTNIFSSQDAIDYSFSCKYLEESGYNIVI